MKIMSKYRKVTHILLYTDTIRLYQKNDIQIVDTIRYDTDNIDIGDISRYFRYIDSALVWRLYGRSAIFCYLWYILGQIPREIGT